MFDDTIVNTFTKLCKCNPLAMYQSSVYKISKVRPFDSLHLKIGFVSDFANFKWLNARDVAKVVVIFLIVLATATVTDASQLSLKLLAAFTFVRDQNATQ